MTYGDSGQMQTESAPNVLYLDQEGPALDLMGGNPKVKSPDTHRQLMAESDDFVGFHR